MRPLKLLGLAPVLLLACACAHSGLRGRVYEGRDLHFRTGPVPSRWRPLDSEALVAYRDGGDAATIALNGRCGKDADDVPLAALTHHLFLLFTRRHVIAQHELQLDGRAALQTELTAALDGVEKHFTVVVLKKDGCVYDFMRIGDAPPTEGDDSFERFVNGFATLDRP